MNRRTFLRALGLGAAAIAAAPVLQFVPAESLTTISVEPGASFKIIGQVVVPRTGEIMRITSVDRQTGTITVESADPAPFITSRVGRL